MKLNYDLDDEEQLYLDGMKAGIRITLDCLKEKMPKFLDMIQKYVDMSLESIDERKTS